MAMTINNDWRGRSNDGAPSLTSIEDLLCLWQDDMMRYAADGYTAWARILAGCISELRSVRNSEDRTVLNLTDAAKRSGYSTDHLRRLMKLGSLQDFGTRHRPRVRLAQLPRKPAPVGTYRVTRQSDAQGPRLVGLEQSEAA